MEWELDFGCVEIDLIVRMKTELRDRLFGRHQVGILASDEVGRVGDLLVQGKACTQQNRKCGVKETAAHLDAEDLRLRDSAQIC